VVKDKTDSKEKAFKVFAVNALGYVQLGHASSQEYKKEGTPWSEGMLISHMSMANTNSDILGHEELLGQRVAYHSIRADTQGNHRADTIFKV
jgi:hypothetical protein